MGQLGINDFDVVLFLGVYYHLKDPLSALATLRQVVRDNGTLLVEGAVLTEPGCFARFYYTESYLGDSSNWWIPTRDCLRQWIACSYFEITQEWETIWSDVNPRATLLTKAIRHTDPLYKYPSEVLEQFNSGS